MASETKNTDYLRIVGGKIYAYKDGVTISADNMHSKWELSRSNYLDLILTEDIDCIELDEDEFINCYSKEFCKAANEKLNEILVKVDNICKKR